MRKTLSLILITILSIGAIYALVCYIRMDGFAFAWALHFLLMLCVSFFTTTLKSELTSSYYQEKGWERTL